MLLIINPKTLRQQRETLDALHKLPSDIEPLKNVSYSGNPTHIELGNDLLKTGAMGCVVVSGGQGTRLRFDKPKGMYPISPVKHKTLFQLIAEKTAACSRCAGIPLPLAIMTSPENHDEIAQFFKENNHFGLDPSQVDFFHQELLPFLDREGNPFYSSPDEYAAGPDGNGYALRHFVEQGIWDKWRAKGVRYLNFLLVDNPLADPFDANLLGFHVRTHADITIKCTERISVEERVGVVVSKEGRPAVVEYTELPPDEGLAIEANKLKFAWANLSLFCFSMDFVKRAESFELPLHAAFKAAVHMNERGESVLSEKPIAWKFERYIFDILPFAPQCEVLIYPRDDCFAPLKNKEGMYSPATVQQALSDFDKRVYHSLCDVEVAFPLFELSAEFHYPTQRILDAWRGVVPTNAYVDASSRSV